MYFVRTEGHKKEAGEEDYLYPSAHPYKVCLRNKAR